MRANQVQPGLPVAYPWSFQNGHKTSRTTAINTAAEIGQHGSHSSVPNNVARQAWASGGHPAMMYGQTPSRATLRKYGRSVNAANVLYGSVSWHTRSIWVNAGPKTISTATVNVNVFDVAKNRVVYTRKGVSGRSDEKSNGYKIAAAVILTPLVTAVSGGPATPQEQRAVQIALGRAYAGWVGL